VSDEPLLPEGDFFDPSFLAELEELAVARAEASGASTAVTAALASDLESFLAPHPGEEGGPLDQARFCELPGPVVNERLNGLIEICRRGGLIDAVQAVESFIVFVQALLPALPEEAARQVKGFTFRLVPTLIHIAHNDFGETDMARSDGRTALRNLETILIEISSIRLAPSESELIFRNIDRMAELVAVGEYGLANEVISSQLLGIIQRNRMARSLYRIMEVEVNVQRYLKETLGYTTPQIRLPADLPALADYGPVRVLEEGLPEGGHRRFIQFHVPGITTLRDVVVHLASKERTETYDLRLDALGSAELSVPEGSYDLGLVYQPLET
jgi:hypothetical protein